MPLASAEVPQQPAVHRAEAEIITAGGTGRVWFIQHQPADFAGTEVGVEEQTCAGMPFLLQTCVFPLLADVRGAAVLPHQCWAAGLSSAASPEDRCFPLIGHTAGDDSISLLPADRLFQTLHRQSLTLPDVAGILFHPSVRRVTDGQGRAGAGHRVATRVKQSGAGTAGALIQCEKEGRCCHGRVVFQVLAALIASRHDPLQGKGLSTTCSLVQLSAIWRASQ